MLLSPVTELLGHLHAVQTALTPGTQNSAVDVVERKSASLHSVTSKEATSEGYCPCWESGGPWIVIFFFF